MCSRRVTGFFVVAVVATAPVRDGTAAAVESWLDLGSLSARGSDSATTFLSGELSKKRDPFIAVVVRDTGVVE